jgi:hypothetical protein
MEARSHSATWGIVAQRGGTERGGQGAELRENGIGMLLVNAMEARLKPRLPVH